MPINLFFVKQSMVQSFYIFFTFAVTCLKCRELNHSESNHWISLKRNEMFSLVSITEAQLGGFYRYSF